MWSKPLFVLNSLICNKHCRETSINFGIIVSVILELLLKIEDASHLTNKNYARPSMQAVFFNLRTFSDDFNLLLIKN